MSFRPLRYEPYEATEQVPNVVVDGSPNPATVLTLTHWPGIPAPVDQELVADLSAQMAFRYLEREGSLHGSAEVVTNNHFDQDGLVSVYALSQPADALARRALLEDLARAGDFATYDDRRAARLSMLIAAYADPARSPLAPLPSEYGKACALLYREVLDRLPDFIDRLDDYRALWQDEDRQLTESEAALRNGTVTIEEYPDVDLAVVTMDDTAKEWSGHRFAGRSFTGVHPMALHNATERLALLLVHGRQYRFTYRYETWVQYASRRLRPRVDLAPLAADLTAEETDDIAWQADTAGDLTPELQPAVGAESSIAPASLTARLVQYLAEAPPAWDPYAPAAR